MMYYPYSENKGADQLRGYCEADLRHCFCLCGLLVFSCGGSYSILPSRKKKSTPRHIRVSINYRHIPVHFNKETHRKPSIFCCACFKSDRAAQFIGSFTEHTQLDFK